MRFEQGFGIAGPDRFGADGPGTPPDFVSDDFVRVTGVGVTGGVTEYVWSDFFRIRQGQTRIINELTFSDSPPRLPESIAIVPDQPTLTEPGQTIPVRITATYADGTTDDLTPQSAGTSYRISNPAIATIDQDGLVTALTDGSVFVTAVNQGATAVTQLNVSLDGSLTTVAGSVLDEDGMPVAGAMVSIVSFRQAWMTYPGQLR